MATSSTTIPASLRSSWRFFLERCGYCTPPGRAACALALARAERDAERLGLAVEWEHDPDGCCAPEDCETHCEDCARCRVIGRDDETLASLCGICGSDADYRRTVEAELLSEALAFIAAQPSTFPRARDGSLMRYADGGYPIHYHTADGGELCAECATRHASEWNTDPCWRLIGADIYWEGPPRNCDHCGADMPSAYGDPDAEGEGE